MKYWGIGIYLLLAVVLSCTLFEEHYSGKITVDSVEGGATIRNDTIMAQYQEHFTIVLRTDPPYSKQNGSINFYLAEVNGHAPPAGTEGMEMGPGASPIDPTSGICRSEDWYCDPPVDTVVTVDAYIFDAGEKIEKTQTAITIKSVGP